VICASATVITLHRTLNDAAVRFCDGLSYWLRLRRRADRVPSRGNANGIQIPLTMDPKRDWSSRPSNHRTGIAMANNARVKNGERVSAFDSRVD
jgi:hypothetical protein